MADPNDNQEQSTSAKVKELAKQAIKAKIKAISPAIAGIAILILFLAAALQLIDTSKFKEAFDWWKGFESTLTVGNGTYIINRALGFDYYYSFNDSGYDDAALTDTLIHSGFDPTNPGFTYEAKVAIYKLIQNGVDISTYTEKELLCLPLFIKADAITSYPDLGKDDGLFEGKINVQRIKEDGSTQELHYTDATDWTDLETNANNPYGINRDKILDYYTLTNDGQLKTASKKDTKITTRQTWDAFSPTDTIAETNVEVNTTEYITTTINYKSKTSRYVTSFEFLQALLVKTKNPEFCTQVAQNAIDVSNITISVYENKTVKHQVEVITKTGAMKEEYLLWIDGGIEYKDSAGNAYTHGENGEGRWIYKDYITYGTYKHVVTTTTDITTYTPKIIISYADTIFFHREQSCTKNTINEPDANNNIPGTEKPVNIPLQQGNIWDFTLFSSEATNIENAYMRDFPDRLEATFSLGDAIAAAFSPPYGDIIRTAITQKIDYNSTTTTTGYEYEANVPIESVKLEGDNGFYDVFIKPENIKAREFIYETAPHLFELLKSNDRTKNYVPVLKYILYTASGRSYGVTDEASILNTESGELTQANSGSTYIVKTDAVSALPTLTKDQLTEAIEALPTMFYGTRKTNALSILDDLKTLEGSYKVNATFALAVVYEESKVGTVWDYIDPSTNNWYSIQWNPGNTYSYYTDIYRHKMVYLSNNY